MQNKNVLLSPLVLCHLLEYKQGYFCTANENYIAQIRHFCISFQHRLKCKDSYSNWTHAEIEFHLPDSTENHMHNNRFTWSKKARDQSTNFLWLWKCFDISSFILIPVSSIPFSSSNQKHVIALVKSVRLKVQKFVSLMNFSVGFPMICK